MTKPALNKPPCLPVAAIVLAAGAATRMGSLKQLLRYGNQTLVEHAIRHAMEAGFAPVIVVVGAEAQAVRAAIAALPVEIVQNDAWQLGMGSSIVTGMRTLQQLGTDSAAVAILLADQPLVTAQHLTAMRKLLHTADAPVVAAEYSGTLGVPALFKRDMFGVLAALTPEAGARHVLRDSGIDVISFALAEAAIDLDTPDDFAAFELKSRATS